MQAERLPLRGYAKRSFLQAIDVTRGAARRYGQHLVIAGELDDVDDVFFFTESELARPLPAGAKDLVARRRERRALFQRLTFPGSWTGRLVPCVVNTRTGTSTLRTGDRVRVDGRAGTVEILERAGAQAAA